MAAEEVNKPKSLPPYPEVHHSIPTNLHKIWNFFFQKKKKKKNHCDTYFIYFPHQGWALIDLNLFAFHYVF